MTTKQLTYWLALNDQLEREVTEPPKDLKVANAELESRLLRVPNGEDRVKFAKEQSKSEYYRVLAASWKANKFRLIEKCC